MFNPRFSVLALTGLVAATSAFALGSRPKVDEEAVNARIAPVAQVSLAAGGGAAPGSRSGEDMYKLACNGCHAAGTLGAPKFGNSGDWGPRLGKGLDGLLKNALSGIRSMPAKGGVADATDAELARAIVYMANHSGGSLKEPK